MRIEHRINLSLWVAALAAAVAMMVAPLLFPPDTPHLYLWICFIAGVLLAILAIVYACALAISESPKDRGLPKRKRMAPLIGMIIFGFGFVACAAWYLWPNSMRLPDEQALRSPPPTETPIGKPDILASTRKERVFVGESITLAYLMGLYHVDDRTSFQARKDTEPFVGKWIKISGIVEDVSFDRESPKFAYLMFEKDPSIVNTSWLYWTTLHIRFREPWIERVLILRRGDKLTIICQIDSIESHTMNLDNCEIAGTR